MNEEELFCKLFPEYVVNGKPLSPYSDLFESGYKQSEKRIEELEAEVKEWKDKADLWCKTANLKDHNIMINKELEKENTELKELIEKYRQAVDKCLHITFMGGGCEVNTIGQYATLVDGYLTDVEGLAKWKK